MSQMSSNGKKNWREDVAWVRKNSNRAKHSCLKQKLKGCGASVHATDVSIHVCNKKVECSTYT